MAIALLLALAACAQPTALIRPAAEIHVPDGRVRLGDLARVDGTERAREIEHRLIASLPLGRRSVTLSNGAVAALIRRAVPGLAVQGGPASVVIHRDPEVPLASPALACAAADRPIGAGAVLRPADLVATSCVERGREQANLRFDRGSGSVRTTAALRAGSYIGRIALPDFPDVERGQELTVISVAGAVRIQRPVVALQTGRDGRRVFVRDAEGQVFTAPVTASSGGRP